MSTLTTQTDQAEDKEHNSQTCSHADHQQKRLLPVTVLGGFLGAGKTTLMKHILETKQKEEGAAFKCAIIVNDVAELNVDKNLIDQSAIRVGSVNKVIAMQNGCICCTLSVRVFCFYISSSSSLLFLT